MYCAEEQRSATLEKTFLLREGSVVLLSAIEVQICRNV